MKEFLKSFYFCPDKKYHCYHIVLCASIIIKKLDLHCKKIHKIQKKTACKCRRNGTTYIKTINRPKKLVPSVCRIRWSFQLTLWLVISAWGFIQVAEGKCIFIENVSNYECVRVANLLFECFKYFKRCIQKFSLLCTLTFVYLIKRTQLCTKLS